MEIFQGGSSQKFFNYAIFQLHTVLKVPGFSITSYIPEVIDGIFKALDDQATAVREVTVSVLGELLYKLDPKEGVQVRFQLTYVYEGSGQ